MSPSEAKCRSSPSRPTVVHPLNMSSDEWREEPLSPEAAAALEADTYRVFHQPVDGYIGLTKAEAEARAAQQGRHITWQDRTDKGRANLDFRRLRAVLDDEGRVRDVVKDQDYRGLAGPPPTDG